MVSLPASLRRISDLTENRWLGHLLFLAGAGLAAWFFRERMCILDPGIYTFEMLVQEDFTMPHHRYGNVLFQIFPLLAIKLGFSLKGVLIVHSVAYVFVYYLFFLFAKYICRRPGIAWAILLVQLLVYHRTYYWPVSEAFHSVMLGVALYAWFSGGTERRIWIYLPVAAILTWLMLVMHPIALAVIAFAIGMHFVDSWRWKDLRFWGLAAVVAGTYLGWKTFGPPPTEYELRILDQQPGWLDLIRNLRSYVGYMQIKGVLEGELKMIPVFTAVVVAGLLVLRKWRHASYLLGFSVLYFLAVVRTYHMGESRLLLQNVTVPLALFATLFFVRHILPAVSWKFLQYGFLLFLLFFFHHNISQRFQANQDRIAWHNNMAHFSAQIGEDKLVLDRAVFPNYLFKIDWAVAVESLLLSSVNGPEHSMQVYHHNGREQLLLPENGVYHAFAPFWLMRWVVDLPPEYFGLKEVPFFDLNAPVEHSCRKSQGDIQAEKYALATEVADFQAGKMANITVSIRNDGQEFLVAAPGDSCAYGLGYYFEREGKLFPEAPNHIPLSVNIPPGTEFRQLLQVFPPNEPGDYTLHLVFRRNFTSIDRLPTRQRVTVH